MGGGEAPPCNSLSGTIPPEIGNLKHLTNLELDGNLLSGTIPPEITKLPLYWLSLAANPLSGTIPPGIANLTDLSFLRLGPGQNTSLSGTMPSAICNLVVTGHLTHCELEGIRISSALSRHAALALYVSRSPYPSSMSGSRDQLLATRNSTI